MRRKIYVSGTDVTIREQSIRNEWRVVYIIFFSFLVFKEVRWLNSKEDCIRDIENAATMLGYVNKYADQIYYLEVIKKRSAELKRILNAELKNK